MGTILSITLLTQLILILYGLRTKRVPWYWILILLVGLVGNGAYLLLYGLAPNTFAFRRAVWTAAFLLPLMTYLYAAGAFYYLYERKMVGRLVHLLPIFLLGQVRLAWEILDHAAGVLATVTTPQDLVAVLDSFSISSDFWQTTGPFDLYIARFSGIGFAVVTSLLLAQAAWRWWRLQQRVSPEYNAVSYLIVVMTVSLFIVIPTRIWLDSMIVGQLTVLLLTLALGFMFIIQSESVLDTFTRFLGRYSIGLKLEAGFGLALMLAGVLVAISVATIGSNNFTVENVTTVQHEILEATTQLMLDFRATRIYERNIVANASGPTTQAVDVQMVNDWQQAMARVQADVEHLKKLPLTERQQNTVRLIESAVERYRNDIGAMLGAIMTRGDEQSGEMGRWYQSQLVLQETVAANETVYATLAPLLAELRQVQLAYMISGRGVRVYEANQTYTAIDKALDEVLRPQLPFVEWRAIDRALENERAAFQGVVRYQTEMQLSRNSMQGNALVIENWTRELSSQANQQFEESVISLLEQQARGTLTLLGVATLITLVVLFVSRTVSQQIIQEALQLADAAQRMASGELTARVNIVSRDELGLVGRTFNEMAARLQDLLETLDARVRRRTSQLETAALVSQESVALQGGQVDELLQRTVELIRERFGFYHAQVFLVDENNEWAVLRASTGEAGRQLLARGHKLQVGSRSVIGRVTADGVPVVARDTDKDSIHRKNELLPQTRAELAVPMKLGDRIIGALDVQSVKPDAFGEDDVVALQILANQIATAVNNARLLRRVQDTLRTTNELYTRSRLIAEATEETEVLQQLDEALQATAVETLRLREGFLATVDSFTEGTVRIECMCVLPTEEKQVFCGQVVPLFQKNAHAFMELLAQDEAVLLDQDTRDVLSEEVRRIVEDMPYVAILPLVVERTVFAVAVLAGEWSEMLSIEQLTPYLTLFDQAGTVIENIRLLRRTAKALESTNRLYQTVSRFAQAESVETIADVLADTARAQGFDGAYLAVLPKPVRVDVEEALAHEYIVVPRTWVEGLPDTPFRFRWRKQARAFLKETFTNREYVGIEHEEAHHRVKALIRAEGVTLPEFQTMLFRPLMTRDQMTGVLLLVARDSREIDRETERFFLSLTEQTSISLETVMLFEQTRRSLERTEALYEAGRLLTQADEHSDLAAAALPLARYFGHQWVSMPLLVEETGEDALVNYVADVRHGNVERRLMSKAFFDMARTLFEENQPYIAFDDVENAPLPEQLRKLLQENDIRVLLSVPLRVRGQVQGFLVFSSVEPHAFTEEELEVARAFAAQMALALESLQLIERIENELRETQALYRVSHGLLQAETPRDMARLLFESAKESGLFTPDVPAFIAVDELHVDPHGRVTSLRVIGLASSVPSAEDRFEGRVFDVREMPAMGTLDPNTDTPLVFEDIETADALTAADREAARALNFRSTVLVPFRIGTDGYGLIQIGQARPRAYTPSEIQRIQTLAGQIGVVLENRRLFERTQQALQETRTLYDTIQNLLMATTIEDIQQRLYETLAERVHPLRVGLWLFDRPHSIDEHPEGLRLVSSGGAEAINMPIGSYLPADRFPTIKRLRASEPFFIIDAEAELEDDPALREVIARTGARALAVYPLTRGDTWFGVAIVTWAHPRKVSEDEDRLLAAIFAQTAIVLQNRRLLETVQQTLERTQRLYRASRRMSAASTIQEIADAFLEALEDRWESVGLLLFPQPVNVGETPPEKVILRAAAPIEKAVLPPGTVLERPVIPMYEHVMKERIVIVEDAATDERLTEHARQILLAQKARRLALIQLVVGNRWLGWVSLRANDIAHVDAQQLDALLTLADQAAVVLENLRLFQSAQRRAWREETVARIASKVFMLNNPRDVLEVGMQELQQALGVRRVAAWIETAHLQEQEDETQSFATGALRRPKLDDGNGHSDENS